MKLVFTRKMMLVTICWLAGSPLGALAMDAETTNRMEALRLYQEALFQETGTGNLEAAYQNYKMLADKNAQYPDIAAVAYYHLGLVLEKLGQEKQAQGYYQLVSKNYPGEIPVVKRVEEKIEAYRKKQVVLDRLNVEPGKTDVFNLVTPVAHPKDQRPSNDPVTLFEAAGQVLTPIWGIGLHTLGLQVQRDLSGQNMLEIALQWQEQDLHLGGRFYRFVETAASAPVQVYTGIQANYMLGLTTAAGYSIGVFAGVQYKIIPALGISGDLGYYYSERDLDQQPVDTCISGRVNVNYYF